MCQAHTRRQFVRKAGAPRREGEGPVRGGLGRETAARGRSAPEIDYVVSRFPEATIVFPHLGDEKEYEHIFKRIDLVAKHPNCYMERSGHGHDRMGVLEYAVKAIGPDRVLFGSDFSINDPSTVLARVHNSFLTEEQKAKILAGNLETLLARFEA